MKIAQLIPKIKNGSVDNIAIRLAEDFARQGHESYLINWSDDNRLPRAIDPAVKIISLSLPGLSSSHLLTKIARLVLRSWLGRKRYLALIAPWLSRRIDRYLQQEHFDISLLHEHHLFPLLSLSSPNILVAHNTRSGQMPKESEFYRYYAAGYQGKSIIGVSQGVTDDLQQHLKLNPADLQTIYNPIDLAHIRTMAEKPADGLPGPGSYVIALGRNTPQKRFDRLLRAYAAAGISQPLVILGDAGKDHSLHELASSLNIGDQVQFPGFINNPYPWIKGASALILSSDYEGLPTILIEALTLQTPVVSTDCPSGPSEILSGELSQWLVPVEDEVALAEKISLVIQQPPEIAADSAERFSRQVIASHYLAALQAHLDTHPK